jgi:hypothetical protein
MSSFNRRFCLKNNIQDLWEDYSWLVSQKDGEGMFWIIMIMKGNAGGKHCQRE